jgi:hypothetical protein
MTKPRNSAQSWRLLWLIPVAVLAALSIVATGSSSSDDPGDDDVDPPLNILPTYNFFMANLTGNNPFTVSVASAYTVTVDIDGLFPGSVNLDADVNNVVTFLSYIVRSSARVDLTLTSTDPSPLDGTFAVIVTEDINAMVYGEPVSGAFEVVTPTETVSVSILADSIQLTLNGGAPVVYNTWEEFTNLFDDELQEAWQRRAALGAGAIGFVVEQFFSMADIFDELEAVTFASPVVEVCDMFTGTPPEGVLAQGEIVVTWLGSGELSDGDDFSWQFNQCWDADSSELIDGTVSLENYTETIDAITGVLFEIGFGGLSGQPGGVVYDMTISDTMENQGIFTIPPEGVMTINGGFALIIQSP